jgi:hypothetical protein
MSRTEAMTIAAELVGAVRSLTAPMTHSHTIANDDLNVACKELELDTNEGEFMINAHIVPSGRVHALKHLSQQ